MVRMRKNIYFTDKQVERLEKMSQEENLPEAEIVRRALDAYLAWNDPTYHPTVSHAQTGTRHSSPP